MDRHPASGAIACSRPPTPGGLAPDDVMYLDHFRLARIYAEFRQDRREARTESVELLLRVPDLADFKVVARSEADLVVESVRGKDAFLIQATDDAVVLLCRQRRGRKPDKQ